MPKILYVAHCLHSGQEMNYEYTLSLDPDFHALPYLYAISVTQVDGDNREVVATILVKTDLGQSQDEVGQMYAVTIHSIPSLGALPVEQVTLRCTKTNVAPGVTPGEQDFVQIFQDVYTLNSRKGAA